MKKIINNIEKINFKEHIKNCRIQALCDYFYLNNMPISPNLLYLACFKNLYTFAEMSFQNVIYPFISNFDENIEEQFLNEYNFSYKIRNDCVTFFDFKNTLDKNGPFIALCDSAIFSRKHKIQSGKQIGVVSSILVVDYEDKENKIYFPYHVGAINFPAFPFELFQAASKAETLPSSAKNTTIHLLDNELNLNAIKEFKNIIYDNFKFNLKNMLKVNDDISITNNGIKIHKNQGAINSIIKFLKSLNDLLSNDKIDSKIRNLIYSQKLRIMVEFMISGTRTFNRYEIAEAINCLYLITNEEKLNILCNQFRQSANQFRDLMKLIYEIDENKNKKEHLNKVINKFNDIFDFEEKLIMEYLENNGN